MNSINYLHRRLTYFKRLKIKKESINKILTHSSLHNKGVVNIHRTDPTNAGDFYCGPHHYFDQLRGKSLDIFDYKSPEDKIRNNWFDKITGNSLIIGGGGLLCRQGFKLQLRLFEQLGEKGKKTVLWGVGHNAKNTRHYGKISTYNINTDKFGLVGVRDYNMKEEWVPCVSCLHPVFDKKFDTENETGIIFHKKTLKNKRILSKFKDFPSIANNAEFEDIIKFIGHTETIISNSYHAMYWAMLMEKKVVVIPNSSKFFNFKYPPVISNFSTFKHDIGKAKSYSGILEECRQINLKFADKVFDYLDI